MSPRSWLSSLLLLSVLGCTTAPPLSPPPMAIAESTPAPVALAPSPLPSSAIAPSPALPLPSEPLASPTASASPLANRPSTTERESRSTPEPTPTPEPPREPDPISSAPVRMVVLHGLAKTLESYDLESGERGARLSTGLYPNLLLGRGNEAWLVNSGDANIQLVDLPRMRLVRTVELPIGSNPMGLALVDPANALLNNFLDTSLSWVELGDPARVERLALPPDGTTGGGLVLSQGKAYVPAVDADYSQYPTIRYRSSKVYVVSLATRRLLTAIALPPEADPSWISQNPHTGMLLVSTRTGLSEINPITDRLTGRTLEFGAKVGPVVYVDAGRAYAGHASGLVRFNPVSGEIGRGLADPLPASTSDVGVPHLFRGRLYVPDFAQDLVRVVDPASETVLRSYPVGDGPQDLAFCEAEASPAS